MSPRERHADSENVHVGDGMFKPDLHRATLDGANLASVLGLTQAQIDMACVGEQTKLPAELSRPAPCTVKKPMKK